MQTRPFTRLPGLTLALLLTLFISSAGADPTTLEGTWDVTLRFPESTCTAPCSCPGNTPNLPIPALHQYQRHGALLEVSGGSPLRGPGVGSWERFDRHEFVARFKFFFFNPDGSRRGSEEVTSQIRLTGPDEFTATASFDLFDAAGKLTAQGCVINITATRFE
jgi:hypothetical protein